MKAISKEAEMNQGDNQSIPNSNLSSLLEDVEKAKVEKTGEQDAKEEQKRERNPRCDGLLEDIPEWQRDNEFIKTRYRVDYEGACEVASTTCKCHNETVNVCTHLIGSVFMFTLAIFILVDYENVKYVAEQAWDLFEVERSHDQNLELNQYIMEQMKQFEEEREKFQNGQEGEIKTAEELYKENERISYLVAYMSKEKMKNYQQLPPK